MKDYTHATSKIFIIKTPKLKYSDLGYLKSVGDAVSLELFVAGKMVEHIRVDYLICVHAGCMSKSGFNAEYLNATYPDTLLQNVILGRSIYGGKNLQKMEDGFMQTIHTTDVDIRYRVNSKEIYFKDRKNKILFKIRDTNNG